MGLCFTYGSLTWRPASEPCNTSIAWPYGWQFEVLPHTPSSMEHPRKCECTVLAFPVGG